MKKKAGFIMCDYAFGRKNTKGRKMAVKVDTLPARTVGGLDPVGRVRIVKR